MKRVVLISLIVLTLILTACGSQEIYLCPDGSFGGGQVAQSSKLVYYCPDGKATTNYNSCNFVAKVDITQRDAEQKALNFANGHLAASGWKTQLVNANIVDGNWLAQLIVSKYDESSFETIVKIEGSTGFASCEQNCQYIE